MGYAPSRLQQVAGDDGARGVVGGGTPSEAAEDPR